MEPRGTYVTLLLLIVVIGRTTATLPQCPKDEEAAEEVCLLPNPRPMDWRSAHHFCRTKGGFLIGPEEMTRPEVTQLIPGKVTWTALGPHEGHLQWLTQRPVMARDLQWAQGEEGESGGQKCGYLHLSSQLFQPLPCSSALPSVCLLTATLHETYTGDSMELQVEVDGGGVPVEEKDGWVSVTEKGLHQLSLTCTAHLSPNGGPASSQPLVFWSKDGVYIPAHKSTIVPIDDTDPFSSELIQGTYWCEAWLPHSSARIVSNKVLLMLEGHEVLLLHLQDRQSPQSPPITGNTLKERVRDALSLTNVVNTINVVSVVRDDAASDSGSLVTSRVEIHFPSARTDAFTRLLRMLRDERGVEDLLERYGYLASSSASLPTRCRTRTDVLPGGNSVTWPFSEIGKVQPLHYRCEAAGGGLVAGHCRWNYTHGAAVDFDRRKCQRFDFCPRDYTGLAGSFCVSLTSASTWDEGFQATYMSKKTMSLLDAAHLLDDEEALLSLYQEVQMWLEGGEEDGRLWLPARRLAPFSPLAVLSPGFPKQYSSDSGEWLRIYNVSWAAGQPSPEQDCLALDTEASVMLTLPCDDELPFLTVLDVRELRTVPSHRRDISNHLINTNEPLCPGWWGSDYPGAHGTCFKLFSRKVGMGWDEAKALCAENSADLPDPSDGFLDWPLRQYLYEREIESVWIRFPPPPESRDTDGRSGTFLNWRVDVDPSLPYAALTPSGWVREGRDVNKTFVMCQRNFEVVGVPMTMFEEMGNVVMKMERPNRLPTSPLQCYVNGGKVSISRTEDPPYDGSGDDGSWDDGSGEYNFPTAIYSNKDFVDEMLSNWDFDSEDIITEVKVNSGTQGYYECWAWINSPLYLVKSNVLLYRRPDTLTFSIILARQSQYIPRLHDAAIKPKALSPNDTCVVSFLNEIQKDLSSNPVTITTDNFYFLPSAQTDALHLHFHVQFEFPETSTPLMESEANRIIAAALDRLSSRDCRGVSVSSTVGCYKESKQYDEVTLTWPATQGDEAVLPAELCVTDEGDPVIRECLGDFISGYHWGSKSGTCIDQPRNVTQQLWKINQVSSPSDPKLLAALTDNGHSLNTADVHFAALKMRSISRKSSLQHQDLANIVKTLSNVIEAESEVFEHLQGVLNTSNILLQTFKDTSFKVKLPYSSGDQVLLSDSSLVSLARVSAVPHSSIIGYHSWRENKGEEENVIGKGNEDEWRHSEVTLILPDNLTLRVAEEDGIHRVQIMFAVYRNSKLFHDNSSFPNHTVDGYIIQAAYGSRSITHLEEPVKIYFKTNSSGKTSKCVFWDFELNDGRGGWSTVGCWSDGRHKDHIMCQCSHLTCFAHLVNFDKEVVGGVHEIILDTISIIGCSLSIISLLLVLVTFFLFPKWRRRLSNQILVHLAFAILCSLVVFLAGINQTLFPSVCRGVAVALHYFILASFGWMLVEAVHQYLKLVKVLGTYIPRFIWKASLCAWGVPVLPIIAVLIYDTSLYDNDQDSENGICWMSSTAFKYAFFLPLAVIMATNMVLFGIIIYKTTCGRVRITSTLSERQMRLTQLSMAISVFSLLGFTWVFGMLSFWQPNLVFSYLFCITNTTQGFFIFLFHVFRERDAQKLWQDFLSVISLPTLRTSEQFSDSSTTFTR